MIRTPPDTDGPTEEPAMRTATCLLLSLIALSLCGCKPSAPSTQVRPAGNAQQPPPSENFRHLGNDNSSSSPPATPPAGAPASK